MRSLRTGDTVGPYPPDGRVLVTASFPRRVVRWTVDLLVCLVLALPAMLLAFGLVLAATSSEDLAGAVSVPTGYLLPALLYGALSGVTGSVGERIADVRRVRLSDGHPIGVVRTTVRAVLSVLAWPLIVLWVVIEPFSGSADIDQGGRWARTVTVRRGVPAATPVARGEVRHGA